MEFNIEYVSLIGAALDTPKNPNAKLRNKLKRSVHIRKNEPRHTTINYIKLSTDELKIGEFLHLSIKTTQRAKETNAIVNGAKEE